MPINMISGGMGYTTQVINIVIVTIVPVYSPGITERMLIATIFTVSDNVM